MIDNRNPFVQVLEPTPAQARLWQSQLNRVLRRHPALCLHGFEPVPPIGKWVPIGEKMDQSERDNLRHQERNSLVAMFTTFARMKHWLAHMQLYRDWETQYNLRELYDKQWVPYAAMVYGDTGTTGLLIAAALDCGCRVAQEKDDIIQIYIEGFLNV